MSAEQGKSAPSTPRFGRIDADLGDVDRAIAASTDHIFSLQHPDGYWCGELEADSMLEADYIFLHTLLESGDPGRMQRAFTEMMRFQNDDGSWSIYPGGLGNISLTVKCYSSAKIMGLTADEPRMAKARAWILANGGVVASICHGPWILISAGIVRGVRMTGSRGIRDDLVNAGAEWVDEAAVVDGRIVTARVPKDLPAFMQRVLEALTAA